mgnify:CR=1 FL=1
MSAAHADTTVRLGFAAPLTGPQAHYGEDMRNGQDVTPQMFGETFGFRGVEFGNWNNQIERQEVMNAAYDGLMDLAEVVGIPSK